MVYPDSFEGFFVKDHKKWSDFEKQELKPKKFTEDDVDIKIECCGVCGSDVHYITGGWGDTPMPTCVGHEVIGKAIRVGKNVKDMKEGDRVGVGAQVWSCLKCPQCKSDNENFCPHMVDTYGAPYPKSVDPDETMAQGGFASHIRAHWYFVFPIPDNIPSRMAAPMMCAGLTTYSPLVRNGVGPGKNIAIVGMGGLGHFAVMWAVALGAEVTVISHTAEKKNDALKLGAKHFVCNQEKDWSKDLKFTFDFILNCADMTQEFVLSDYLSMLKVNCKFHCVGLPDYPLKELMVQDFVSNGAYIGASHLGSRPEALAMLKLASEKNVKPMIETLDISEKSCKEAVERVKVNDVRYRFTLTGYEKAFGN